MSKDLVAQGISVHMVAINQVASESTQQALTARASFDLLQDVDSVNAWRVMGGGKDDFFIYRSGGSLAPGGYLPPVGVLSTDLSTPQGYSNVRSAIVNASRIDAGVECPAIPPAGGFQLPGDIDQDRKLNVTDAVTYLGHLFFGSPRVLPCEGGASTRGNLALLNLNDDTRVDVSDAIHLLVYLFLGGSPPEAGTECLRMPGCPEACSSP